MSKVGLWVDDSLYLLIINSFEEDFVNVKANPKIMSKVDLVVVDDTFRAEECRENILSLRNVVVLLEMINVEVARILHREGILFDMLSKRNYMDLEEIFQKFSKKDTMYLKIENTSSTSLIKKEEIIYISYDRLGRKSLLTTDKGKIYESKKNLGDLEEVLGDSFLRVERGLVVNRERVKSLDFREEKMIFHGEIELSVGRRTLKKSEDHIFKKNKWILI